MKANARSREILFKELPWVEAVLPLDAVEFNVRLVDLDTLSLVPDGFEYEGMWHNSGKIFFVDMDGQGLGHVGEVVKRLYHRMWSWKRLGFIEVTEDVCEDVKESVEEAIRRLSPRSKGTRFVVQFSNTKEGLSVTIYKVPKRIPDLETWLNDRAEEEAQRLHETLEEVNAQ